MTALTVARAANAAPSARLTSPVALIVGGSAGIGQAIAYKLAQYSDTPHIIISSRSQRSAEVTLKRLQEINGSGKYEFIATDMTQLKSINNLIQSIQDRLSTLNFLIISSGALTTGGRVETEDGIERKMALNYYGRFYLMHGLAPLLQQTGNQPDQEARVMSVLNAGRGGNIHFDDLELKKTYSFKAVRDTGGAFNDMMAEEFSIRYPKVAWMHTYPGFVDTDIMANLPWFLRYPGKILYMFYGIKPEDCGDYLWHGFHLQERKTGWYLLDEKGDTISKRSYHTDEARKIVWDHSIALLKL